MNQLNQRITDLEMPERMRRLPISDEGYPIPYFVPFIDGKPEFRGMDGEKLGLCVRLKRCWLCGQPLGVHMTFPIGPMCAVNRNISEPPSHHACALYGVRACPFLTQPRMRRNEKDLPEGHIAGIGIKRNPGVMCLWTTKSYKVWRPRAAARCLRSAIRRRVEYFAEGRPATREEVLASMESGLPLLMEIAEQEGADAVTELLNQYDKAMEQLPRRRRKGLSK